MGQVLIILNQIGVFLILIFIGILTRKLNILSEGSLKYISQLTVKVALPCFIFTCTAIGTTKEQLIAGLPVLAVGIALYIGLLLLSMLLEKICSLKGNTAHIFRLCLMFGNVGLVGIPLAVELYPENALIYISVFTIIDQIMVWTYGVTLSYDVQKKQKIDLRLLKNILKSPPVVAIIIAVIFVLLGLQLPEFVNTALTKTGNLLTPLGLIYLGALMSLDDITSMLKRKELYVGIICKMIFFPVLLYIIMSAIGLPNDMCGTMRIIAGLPAFVICPMLAKSNGSDSKYAVGMLLTTTLACLITYPISTLIISLI